MAALHLTILCGSLNASSISGKACLKPKSLKQSQAVLLTQELLSCNPLYKYLNTTYSSIIPSNMTDAHLKGYFCDSLTTSANYRKLPIVGVGNDFNILKRSFQFSVA